MIDQRVAVVLYTLARSGKGDRVWPALQGGALGFIGVKVGYRGVEGDHATGSEEVASLEERSRVSGKTSLTRLTVTGTAETLGTEVRVL